jgi:microcystin-dependent protein
MIINRYLIAITALSLFVKTSTYAQKVLGDNLGNHKATQDLNLQNFNLTNIKAGYSATLVVGKDNISNGSIAIEIGGSNKAVIIPNVSDIFNLTNPSIPSTNFLNGMIAYDIASKKIALYQNSKWSSFLTDRLPAGRLYIGSNNNKALARTVSGDFSINANGIVTINNNAIKQNKFSAGAVTEAKIVDLAVTGAKIKDSEITNSKISIKAIDPSKVTPTYSNRVLTSLSGGRVEWASIPQSFTVGDIKPIITGFGTIPTGWVYCNGQVLNDSASPIDGKTIPNLNGATYLVGGPVSTNGAAVGAASISLTKSNLPPVTLNAVISGTAGVPSGTVTIDAAQLPSHTHTYYDNYFTAVTNTWKDGGNSADAHGSSASVSRASNYDGAHTHDATFVGNALGQHTHTANLVLNTTQSVFNLQPLSYVVTYIMKVK